MSERVWCEGCQVDRRYTVNGAGMYICHRCSMDITPGGGDKMKMPNQRSHQRMVGLRPCDCESLTDLLSLDSTHKSVGKYDMLIQHDQAVILMEQPNGEKCRAQIVIPKRIFRQLLEWYEAEQPNGVEDEQ